MPNFPKWSDTKFRVSLKTVKLTRLSSEMDKKSYEKGNICTNVKNCKVLEVLTRFGPFRSFYQMNIMDAVCVILPESTQTIGSNSLLYF